MDPPRHAIPATAGSRTRVLETVLLGGPDTKGERGGPEELPAVDQQTRVEAGPMVGSGSSLPNHGGAEIRDFYARVAEDRAAT